MIPNCMYIYVIEDDRAVCRALTVFLEEEGYCVFAYENACSFLRNAEPRSHDLILLDIGLPDISGVELYSLLRKRGVQSPILTISGLRAGPYEAAIQKIQPVASFRKPLNLEALLSGIETALRT